MYLRDKRKENELKGEDATILFSENHINGVSSLMCSVSQRHNFTSARGAWNKRQRTRIDCSERF